MTFLNKISKPSLFRNSVKKLLNFKFSIDTPPRPIVEVGERYLKLEIDRSMIRNWGIPICFLTGLYLGYTYIDDFYGSWKNRELASVKFIDRRKKLYGEDYFQVTDNKVAKEIFEGIGKDETLSIMEYVYNYRYNPEIVGGSKLGYDIFRSTFILFVLAISIYYFIRFKINKKINKDTHS